MLSEHFIPIDIFMLSKQKKEPLDKNKIFIQIESPEQHIIVMDIFSSMWWKREDWLDPKSCRFLPWTSVRYADEFYYWSHCAAGVFGKVITFQEFTEGIGDRTTKLVQINNAISYKWNPVRIGDVLGSLTRDSWHLRDELFGKWSKFRLPIDDQSEECVDFVYSLIKK